MKSSRFKNWISQLDAKTCLPCKEKNGKIYSMGEFVFFPEHFGCRCRVVPLGIIKAGFATNDGIFGADWYLNEFGELPEHYIRKSCAKDLGWEKWKGNLSQVAPNKIIGGDTYYNREGKLPQKANRTWKEADINYNGGYRSLHRIVYSNDGLIFVTYDHFETFFEIKGVD